MHLDEGQVGTKRALLSRSGHAALAWFRGIQTSFQGIREGASLTPTPSGAARGCMV